MSSPANPERDIILVFGKTGMGKTRWTRRYLADQKRVIVLDPMREYDGLVFDDLEAMLNHCEAYQTWRVKSEFFDDFPFLCSIAMDRGDCTLAIEESSRVLRTWGEIPRPFEDIVFRGRHRRVSLILVAQRSWTVHIHARSQWTRLITFAQTEDADLRWLSAQIDVGADDIIGLPPGHYFDATPYGVVKKVLADQRPMRYHHDEHQDRPPVSEPAEVNPPGQEEES